MLPTKETRALLKAFSGSGVQVQSNIWFLRRAGLIITAWYDPFGKVWCARCRKDIYGVRVGAMFKSIGSSILKQMEATDLIQLVGIIHHMLVTHGSNAAEAA